MKLTKAQRNILKRMAEGDEVRTYFDDAGDISFVMIENYGTRDGRLNRRTYNALVNAGAIQSSVYGFTELTPAGRAALGRE